MLAASEACQLAEVDRDRLNEAIARGDYACAPDTVPGSRRMFDESAFVALSVYGSLTARGIPPRFAGKTACKVLSAIDNTPDAKLLALIWQSSGVPGAVTPDLDYAYGRLRVPTLDEFEAGEPDAIQRSFFPTPSIELLNVAAHRGKYRVAIAKKRAEEEQRKTNRETRI